MFYRKQVLEQSTKKKKVLKYKENLPFKLYSVISKLMLHQNAFKKSIITHRNLFILLVESTAGISSQLWKCSNPANI